MDFRPVERAAGAFQESVTAVQIKAMCRAALGSQTRVTAAVELGLGLYNNTYRIELGTARPVILRVAPAPERQFRAERDLMRNEVAAVPHLAPIEALIPQLLAADFSHRVIDRDYLVQTMLDGVPAPGNLDRYPRPEWASFFRQLGTITRRIHAVAGERFGPIAGVQFDRWSDAVLASISDIAADLDEAGLDARDMWQVARVTEDNRRILDEIDQPRLMHGDLWTVNILIDPDATDPTITGVVDCDRASWGDPRSDWTIEMAGRRPGTERDAFWDTYPQPAPSPAADVRASIYRARILGAVRLERHRLGRDNTSTYGDMRAVLDRLAG
jgi:aminoglycoside phosphotransferase (APT) family kinase protein